MFNITNVLGYFSGGPQKSIRAHFMRMSRICFLCASGLSLGLHCSLVIRLRFGDDLHGFVRVSISVCILGGKSYIKNGYNQGT